MAGAGRQRPAGIIKEEKYDAEMASIMEKLRREEDAANKLMGREDD